MDTWEASPCPLPGLQQDLPASPHGSGFLVPKRHIIWAHPPLHLPRVTKVPTTPLRAACPQISGKWAGGGTLPGRKGNFARQELCGQRRALVRPASSWGPRSGAPAQPLPLPCPAAKGLGGMARKSLEDPAHSYQPSFGTAGQSPNCGAHGTCGLSRGHLEGRPRLHPGLRSLLPATVAAGPAQLAWRKRLLRLGKEGTRGGGPEPGFSAAGRTWLGPRGEGSPPDVWRHPRSARRWRRVQPGGCLGDPAQHTTPRRPGEGSLTSAASLSEQPRQLKVRGEGSGSARGSSSRAPHPPGRAGPAGEVAARQPAAAYPARPPPPGPQSGAAGSSLPAQPCRPGSGGGV